MQAQLRIRRFPSMLLVVIFAVALALVVGGALGYTLKAATVVNAPARAAVPSGQSGSPAVNDACVFVDKHKGC